MAQAAPAAGGAPAPGSAPSTSAPAGGGEPSFDPKAALAEIRRANGATQKLQTAFDSHRQETSGDRELLQRLKSAISPEAKAPPSAIQSLEAKYDAFLDKAMELKSQGQRLPVTEQIAMDFYQSQIESLKTIEALKTQIADLKGGVDRANDPEAPVNNIAYTQMDTFLQQSIDNLYGTDPKQLPAKRRVYQAVTEQLSDELKGLQKSAPGQWDMLRRNPMKLQQVVNDVLRTIVPPKAMAMIEQEELENTPQTAGQLWATFREAQKLFKDATTHEEKLHALGLQRQIRQDIQALDAPKPRRQRHQ